MTVSNRLHGMTSELNKADIHMYCLHELYKSRFGLGLYPNHKIRSKSGNTIGQVQYNSVDRISEGHDAIEKKGIKKKS